MATISGDVQYSQVMGQLPTPELFLAWKGCLRAASAHPTDPYLRPPALRDQDVGWPHGKLLRDPQCHRLFYLIEQDRHRIFIRAYGCV